MCVLGARVPYRIVRSLVFFVLVGVCYFCMMCMLIAYVLIDTCMIWIFVTVLLILCVDMIVFQ